MSVSFSARRAACSKQPRIAGKCNSFRFSTSAVLTWPTPLIAPPPRSQLDQTSFDLNSAVGPVGSVSTQPPSLCFWPVFFFLCRPPVVHEKFRARIAEKQRFPTGSTQSIPRFLLFQAHFTFPK